MYNISHCAFGIVHKEFHLPTCQIVAIKHYRSNNIESINSLKKEIKIYNEFKNNKYIINMIEYGVIKNENKLCIAMEYMNMSSLNKNKYLFINNTINKIKYTCFCILKLLKIWMI
ncbi:MAG: protein kinase [Chloroflexi bacterium]|nr:protein kinase [Chloroflexota bacterium]